MKSGLKTIERLMKAEQLDAVLVFGNGSEYGDLKVFAEQKDCLYNYFLKEGENIVSGYMVPEHLVEKVGNVANLVSFNDENVTGEMKKLLAGKKRVGLIGGVPAYHFSECQAEFVMLEKDVELKAAAEFPDEIEDFALAAGD